MFGSPVPSQDGSCKLRCVIENDLVFIIEVPCRTKISDLKAVIQRKRATDLLKDVSPDALELWKPKDSNPIIQETLAEHVKSLGDSISRVADQLYPTDCLLSIFPSQPPVEYVHVIVKVARSKRNITPKEYSLDLEVIDARIDEELNSLREAITTFLKNPEPPTWVPPDYVMSNRKFLESLEIPCYNDGNPSLLFHDLHVCDDDEIKEMFGSHKHLCICNTSGSGKTRRMLEGLTKYWGFYFVAVPDANSVGVRDLQDTLTNVAGYDEWVSDLCSLPLEQVAHQNDINSRIATKHLRKLLAARIVVFQLFLELAIEVDGEILEKHKRIWLLFQLSDRLGGRSGTLHPFVRIMEKSLTHASNEALIALVNRFPDILDQYIQHTHFIIGLDEAQRAARQYPNSFVSSTSDGRPRSIIREIVKVFTKLPIKLVVSGTGLSLEDMREAMASGVSKSGEVEVFHRLGMFDTWPKLELFVKRYIPSSILETPSGSRLQQRIREYLLGRYRFSVSFLEFFLRNGLESPHKLLNSYINKHTTCLPGDSGGPFTFDEPELRIQVTLRGFEWDRLKLDWPASQEAKQIVQSHLTQGKSPTFGPVTTRLVEYGLARLHDGQDEHEGHIVEPLAFLSLIRWLQNQDRANLETDLQSRLANPNSRGPAYEELMILYLLRTLRHPVCFSAIFNFHNPPAWVDDKVQIVGCLDGINVPVDVLGDSPQNPGLGVVHYASNIDDVIDWIQTTGTASAVLVATHLFGPDVLIRCHSLPSNSTIASRNIFLMGQFKSYLQGNKECLDAGTIGHALTSLHPNHWFKHESSHQRQKLIGAMEKHTILRFIGGYPLLPNLKLAASSVNQAIDVLGPNAALALIELDEFKSQFISEDEVKNVLAPMEHALTCKRKSGVMSGNKSKRSKKGR